MLVLNVVGQMICDSDTLDTVFSDSRDDIM